FCNALRLLVSTLILRFNKTITKDVKKNIRISHNTSYQDLYSFIIKPDGMNIEIIIINTNASVTNTYLDLNRTIVTNCSARLEIKHNINLYIYIPSFILIL